MNMNVRHSDVKHAGTPADLVLNSSEFFMTFSNTCDRHEAEMMT